MQKIQETQIDCQQFRFYLLYYIQALVSRKIWSQFHKARRLAFGMWYLFVVHVILLCGACDTTMWCMWYLSVVHVILLCGACDISLWCMWYLFVVYVILLCGACDTSLWCMWYFYVVHVILLVVHVIPLCECEDYGDVVCFCNDKELVPERWPNLVSFSLWVLPPT